MKSGIHNFGLEGVKKTKKQQHTDNKYICFILLLIHVFDFSDSNFHLFRMNPNTSRLFSFSLLFKCLQAKLLLEIA